MSIPPGAGANLPLPQWAHVPGDSAEAEADQDTLWQVKALGTKLALSLLSRADWAKLGAVSRI